MWRFECEHFRLTSHVWPRRAVVDDVSNEELLVLLIDVRDEGPYSRRTKLHPEIPDWFCEQKHLFRKRLRDGGNRSHAIRSDGVLTLGRRRGLLVDRKMHRLY